MKLNKEILNHTSDIQQFYEYSSCLNARGVYMPIQFVIKLRYDVHKHIENISNENFESLTLDEIQALSVYFHETTHWWQHIGSTSGFILSLCLPTQIHLNISSMMEFAKKIGLKKPIIQYSNKYISKDNIDSEESRITSYIINNFFDIEFFQQRIIKPKSIDSMYKNKYFESVGHSFYMAYSGVINTLSACFDPELKFFPRADLWGERFEELNKRKLKGYSYGSKQIINPDLGLFEIYEGQARFQQIQYLYFSTGCHLTWEDFEKLGLLNGEYYHGFSIFLQILGEERPVSIDSPLVALYLLVLDISMNPTEGFPFEISDYDMFIENTDPGTRFLNLCKVVKDKHPELKEYIKNYSKDEYLHVSFILNDEVKSKNINEVYNKINEWVLENESLKNLIKEDRGFNFNPENLPIRVIFSRYISFQLDKCNYPEFFCWSGRYITAKYMSEAYRDLYVKHQALFKGGEDGDIYPSIIPGRSHDSIMNTFNDFYSWISIYELSKQWIISDGEFDFDYFWLTSKYSIENMKAWGDNNFKNIFNFGTDDFELYD